MRLPFWGRKQREDELEEEIQRHLQMAIHDRIERGETAEQAESSARREMGNLFLIKETTRDMWGWRWLEQLGQDLRYGLRVLARNPGFTAVAMLTLALGIGANTAIFSIMHATLFRSLPYPHSDQLVMVWGTKPDGCCWHGTTSLSAPNFMDYKEQNSVFKQMGGFSSAEFNLTGDDNPEHILAGRATADFFDLLEIKPTLGRTFLPDEETAGQDQVVVLSQDLWQRRFGSDPNIVGQTIRLDQNPYTVIGVLPAAFDFSIPEYFPPRDLWIPRAVPHGNRARGLNSINMIGRLKPGIALAQARADFAAISARLQRDYPEDDAGIGAKLLTLHEQVVGDIRPLLLILFGAVSFVLLIACANVANLQLARASTRQKEIALRTVLGASRGRLLRQLLTESLLLAVFGGALGVVLAWWGIKLLPQVGVLGALHSEAIRIDMAVLAYSLAVSLFTGCVFGLMPALRASVTRLSESLKDGGKSSATGEGGGGLRGLLTVAAIALSMILLIGAGLLIRSFAGLVRVKPGFETQNILVTPIDLQRIAYPSTAKKAAFYSQLLQRVRTLPGVTAAGAINDLPLIKESVYNLFSIEGHPPSDGASLPNAHARWVTADYLQTMGIPLLSGRAIAETDTESAPPVVLINQSLAHRYFANADPVGQRLKFGPATSARPWATIVGVVADVRDLGLDKEADIEIFGSYQQDILGYPLRHMNIVVRAKVDPKNLATAVRGEVHSLDRNLPPPAIQTMAEVYAESIADRRSNMILLGLFAGIAILLAAVGIYGVIGYSVARRTHEIGIRMALGARPREISGLILRQGLTLTLIGVAVGLGGALVATRVLTAMLYDISPTDTITFFGISLLLISVSLLASYLPARRAMRVDPIVALRYE